MDDAGNQPDLRGILNNWRTAKKPAAARVLIDHVLADSDADTQTPGRGIDLFVDSPLDSIIDKKSGDFLSVR